MDAAIPLSELTTRQLMFHLLNRTETLMADLTQSVADLQAAVDDIGIRFNEQLAPLQQALADATAEVQRLVDEDVLEDAAQADALNALLQQASDAADQINSQVDELNSIGAAPEEPPADPEQPELPVDEPTP